jgi:CDP-diacylglycerol--glycerol-3-phosphate 3-phosphatidyltransferase/cardiolipin synthase
MIPMPRTASAAARSSWLGSLGHLLTGMRLASCPFIFGWIIEGRSELAASAMGLAMLTDWIDGSLVRRFGRPSNAGAWFDVWADFLVIMSAFVAFAVDSILSAWPLVWIGGSFFMFIATSGLGPSIYDPLGRYIGGILMAAALAVLLAQDFVIQLSLEWTVTIACLATMAARAAHAVAAALARP